MKACRVSLQPGHPAKILARVANDPGNPGAQAAWPEAALWVYFRKNRNHDR